MNLTIARSSKRAKEIGVRKVIGATKKDIMNQFFAESLILTAISVIIAIILAWTFLPTFNSLSGKDLSLGTSANLNLILGVIGVALFTGLLCGGYPSLFLSAFQPVKILKGDLKSGTSKSSMRKALIVFQFCVAALLIICTITISSQMNFVLSRNLGYAKENLVTIRMTGALSENYETFKNELLKHSNISSVTSSLHFPLWIASTTNADWEGKESDAKVLMNWDFVNFDYIETMGMEITDGRSFSEDIITDAENACIVNEEAVKIMGIGSPVGKQIKTWFGDLNVVGVVKNFNFESLHNEIKPVILKIRPSWSSYVYARINTDDVSGALSYIENAHKQVNPDFPFSFHFLDKRIEALYSSETKMKSMLTFFSGLAIFIACLGLLGLTVFLSELRTKEIGIRKTLGANSVKIVYLLSKEFLLWVIAANFIAWPIGYFMISKYLENYAYRIDLGWFPFAISAMFSLLIAVITIGSQSIKSSRLNPVESLRYE
jgi:ABC-type lipoprotein release transport system permease subunit